MGLELGRVQTDDVIIHTCSANVNRCCCDGL